MDEAAFGRSLVTSFNFSITENKHFLSGSSEVATETEVDKTGCLPPSGAFPFCLKRFSLIKDLDILRFL